MINLDQKPENLLRYYFSLIDKRVGHGYSPKEETLKEAEDLFDILREEHFGERIHPTHYMKWMFDSYPAHIAITIWRRPYPTLRSMRSRKWIYSYLLHNKKVRVTETLTELFIKGDDLFSKYGRDGLQLLLRSRAISYWWLARELIEERISLSELNSLLSLWDNPRVEEQEITRCVEQLKEREHSWLKEYTPRVASGQLPPGSSGDSRKSKLTSTALGSTTFSMNKNSPKGVRSISQKVLPSIKHLK